MAKPGLFCAFAAALLALGGPASAQVTEIDPNSAIGAGGGQKAQAVNQARAQDQAVADSAPADTIPEAGYEAAATADPPLTSPSNTVPPDDIFTAAEGVFGKGAEGLAGIIEKILKDQGEPSAYIAGQEAGGAFILGVRYGSGVMRHRVEGDRLVYWTGPSIGFDFGGDASKVFVLVYNLHDSQDLYRRYPSAEGRAFAVGGFTASYLRRGDVVLIPVRMGVGLRLGLNAGYMRFTEKNRWLPF